MTVQITKNANNMTDGINNMTDAMIEDYNDFISTERMQDTFANGFEIRKGKKYIKVINQNAVKCFIVNTTEDKVFDYGDILKPAGWNAPARNYKRGNVLEGNYLMNWTGPVYMSYTNTNYMSYLSQLTKNRHVVRNSERGFLRFIL